MMEDHYNTLGINKNAGREKIRKAYRECCKKYHPDICEKGEQPFKDIQRAYEVLSDKNKDKNKKEMEGFSRFLFPSPVTWSKLLSFD